MMLLVCLALPAWAEPAALTVQTLADPARARLCRDQEVVLEIEGGSAQDARRAVDLARRSGPAFRVTTSADRALLWSGPDLLAEITQTQAARWGTTPYSLARTFATRLEQARSGKVPSPPTLAPSRLAVPLGETRSARWLNVPGTPTVEVSNPSVAEVQISGQEVRVAGQARGDATVTLSWPKVRLVLPLSVRPRAARLPSTLEVPLSGGLPPHEALRRVLLGRAHPHPLARLETALPPAAAPDKPLAVEARASGPDLLEDSARIQVRFVPTPVEIPRAGGLVISNRPEKVQAAGILLRHALPAAPVRLLVHHRNAPEAPERFLEVLLHNRSGEPARVFTILAGVGPSQDEIFAGHLATRRFLEALKARQGVTLNLAAGETLLVERLRMKPGQTVSAMGWLQPQGQAVLEMTVRAVDDQGQAPDLDLADPGPGPFPTGRGYFPAEMSAAYAHDLGSRFTFIPLGDTPVTSDPATGEPNPGNFGVVQRLLVVLRNPTDQAREARLDFHPRGGPARGLVYVDGALVETPMATAASPSRLGRWTLAPGEVREVRLETFPQSGSNYPVNLEVHSDFLGLPSMPAPQVGPLDPCWLP